MIADASWTFFGPKEEVLGSMNENSNKYLNCYGYYGCHREVAFYHDFCKLVSKFIWAISYVDKALLSIDIKLSDLPSTEVLLNEDDDKSFLD